MQGAVCVNERCTRRGRIDCISSALDFDFTISMICNVVAWSTRRLAHTCTDAHGLAHNNVRALHDSRPCYLQLVAVCLATSRQEERGKIERVPMILPTADHSGPSHRLPQKSLVAVGLVKGQGPWRDGAIPAGHRHSIVVLLHDKAFTMCKERAAWGKATHVALLMRAIYSALLTHMLMGAVQSALPMGAMHCASLMRSMLGALLMRVLTSAE
eukprot:1157130-Pelagomonas_calceolata.AAC.5